MRTIYTIYLILILGISPIFCSAQNPTDACGAGVATLVSGASCSSTAYVLAGTYADGGAVNASCAAGQDRDDGWFQFVATTTSTTVNLDGDRSHLVAVFTGSCGTGELGCDAQVAGTTASVTVPTTIGNTYYIQVHRRAGNNAIDMNGTICVFGGGGGGGGGNHNIGSGDLNACSGSLFDTGGSGGAYGISETIEETYCSDAGNCIEISFSSFNTESGYDELSIHDGPNSSSPLIGTFSGTTVPGAFTSYSGCITFAWSSDGSVTNPGWEASISCVPCPVPSCTDGILNGTETGVDCGGTCPICPPQVIPTPCATATYMVNSGDMFYDDGGPGGEPCTDPGAGNFCNCSCITTTTLCPTTPGASIQVDFQAFAMFNTTSAFDWMEVYDNNTASGTILWDNSPGGAQNPFGDCGDEPPFATCATNPTGCLTFSFYASGVVNRAGWEGLVSYCSLLPIELSLFKATAVGDKMVEIDWETAWEKDFDHFEVQKSRNALDWMPLSQVQGQSNSTGPQQYSVTDSRPYTGLSYYRLKQVEADGRFEFSDIESVRIIELSEKEIRVYPNPAIDVLFIEIENANPSNFIITDMLGQETKVELPLTSLQESIYSMDISRLGKGIYILKTEKGAEVFYKH